MISEIQTINRFLASVRALETDAGAKETDVAEYYTTQYVYPIKDALVVAKDFCIMIRFAECVNNRLHLSDIGRTYLDLGRKKGQIYILEPNQKQKDFLSKKVFLVPNILDLVKKILYNFNRGSNGELRLPKEEATALKDQNLLGLLLQLEILIEKENFLELSPKYIKFLSVAISDTVMVVSPEAFERSEAEKKEISKIAEGYVLESERKRLNDVGALEQLKKIDHIALRNIAAGYDIASFNDKNSESHDRFIEVKAGKSTPIRFFLSRNEFETAKGLKDCYYVYYVCMKNKKPQQLYVFQGPAESIMKDPKFTTNIELYEIAEK